MLRVLFYILSDNISSDGISLRNLLVINKQEKKCLQQKDSPNEKFSDKPALKCTYYSETDTKLFSLHLLSPSIMLFFIFLSDSLSDSPEVPRQLPIGFREGISRF